PDSGLNTCLLFGTHIENKILPE
ncbi:hypothetical protein A4X06_0g3043, partial [Tilletia controversa]